MKRITKLAISLVSFAALAVPAFAGPPLACHRLEIGDAKSLPWTGSSWNASIQNYDTKNLTRDTLAILDGGAPVIVRMETLRRATLYARSDARAAKELFTRLYQRADSNKSDSLAWFDVGYLAEVYKQWFMKEPSPAAGIDGYAMVVKALELRKGGDPEMEFAAALITIGSSSREHSEHTRRAVAGAKEDALLATNLAQQFIGNQHETVSQALTKSMMVKEAQR